jgi:hypothetical protein
MTWSRIAKKRRPCYFRCAIPPMPQCDRKRPSSRPPWARSDAQESIVRLSPSALSDRNTPAICASAAALFLMLVPRQ